MPVYTRYSTEAERDLVEHYAQCNTKRNAEHEQRLAEYDAEVQAITDAHRSWLVREVKEGLAKGKRCISLPMTNLVITGAALYYGGNPGKWDSRFNKYMYEIRTPLSYTVTADSRIMQPMLRLVSELYPNAIVEVQDVSHGIDTRVNLLLDFDHILPQLRDDVPLPRQPQGSSRYFSERMDTRPGGD